MHDWNIIDILLARRHPQLAFHTMDVLTSNHQGGSDGGEPANTTNYVGSTDPPTTNATAAAPSSVTGAGDGGTSGGTGGADERLAGAAAGSRPIAGTPAGLSADVVFLYHLVPGTIAWVFVKVDSTGHIKRRSVGGSVAASACVGTLSRASQCHIWPQVNLGPVGAFCSGPITEVAQDP